MGRPSRCQQLLWAVEAAWTTPIFDRPQIELEPWSSKDAAVGELDCYDHAVLTLRKAKVRALGSSARCLLLPALPSVVCLPRGLAMLGPVCPQCCWSAAALTDWSLV